LGLHGIGRLKPGVTVQQAQADMNRVSANLAAAYPDTNKGNAAKLIPLKERLVGNVRPLLLLLLGAVGLVLLIACVNVSNLLLARSTGRMHEFAIRAALGAGRGRLLRQSLTESTLLALAGGGLGLAFAAWGTKAALAVLPTTLPRAAEVGLDARVLFFVLGVSLFTGLLCGLAPAVKTSQWRLSETLKEGGHRAGTKRHVAQDILVAVEMGLALVLLIGAGLMLRSLNALWHVDPGFRADRVLTFQLNLPPSMENANEETVRAKIRELSDNLNSMPGVQAVSFSAGASPMQGEDDLWFWIDGQPKPASQSEMNMTLVYRVEPAYLKAFGIPLKQGRFFTNHDDEHSPPVVVIDEVFAHKFFPNQDPIGKRIHLDDDNPPLQIVGVVGHTKQWGLDADDQQSLRAQLYQPFRQLPGAPPFGVDVIMRADAVTGKAATAFFDSIRRVVQSQNSQNVIFKPQTMNQVIAGTLATPRFSMILLNAFGLVALLLASIGLYGVISYLVGQRTHELGIRMALGAQRHNVVSLVIGQGMRRVLVGLALGLAGSFALTRVLGQLLYQIKPTDPLTFGIVSLILLAVAVLACWLPARRAANVDPMTALRHE
jgi:predicted permease